MHRSKIFAPLVAVALLFAACGDDDDTSTATDDTVADETTETATEEETEDDGGSDVDEEAMAEGLGECGFLTGFATAFEDFDPTAMYGGEEATDFGQIFAPLAQATQDVAEAAPEEIRDAFRTMADGFSEVAAELEGVVIDFADPESMDPEAMAKLESLGEAFGDEYEAAAEAVDAWVSENCADLADAFDLDAFGS
ncbi:MAG TPA: hypothetical protein VLR27_06950 [Acidimicrobiales bacterium]|nr:hypothetical protein [Acidimicrobiales bacterium]